MPTLSASESSRWAEVKMDHETEHAAALATVAFLKDVRGAVVELSQMTDDAAVDFEKSFSFDRFNPQHLDFVIATLGSGEVRIATEEGRNRMEETQIPGLWRVQTDESQSFILTPLPRPARLGAACGLPSLSIPDAAPEGCFAAFAVLQELKAAVENTDFTRLDFDPPHTVELTRQPLERADMEWINGLVGNGDMQMWLSGYADGWIRSTAVRGLWRSTLRSKAGKCLLDSFVVSLVPPEVPVLPEDIRLGLATIDSMLEWLEGDLKEGRL